VATNLTRDEARTRGELIGVVAYRVQLDLAGGDTTFRSLSTIETRTLRVPKSTPATTAMANLRLYSRPVPGFAAQE